MGREIHMVKNTLISGRRGRVRAGLPLVFVCCCITLLSGCQGCRWLPGLQGGVDEHPPRRQEPRPYDASGDLREIATSLGVETTGDGASTIASDIKTKLYVDATAKDFPKVLFSERQFKEVQDRLPEEKARILAEYQKFIKSLEGKRFVVVP